MKDVTGENVGIIISFLKGALLLLGNCGKLPTNTMGILKDTFCSAEWEEFTALMTSVYLEYKRKTNVIDYMEHHTLTKREYRTLYGKQKWTASKKHSSSGFYVGTPAATKGITRGVGKRNENDDDGGGKQKHQHRRNGGGCKACNNYGKFVHF